MAPSKSASNLVQGTLSFTSTKRTASLQNTKRKPTAQSKIVSRRKVSISSNSSDEEVDLQDITIPESDEEALDVLPEPQAKLKTTAQSRNEIETQAEEATVMRRTKNASKRQDIGNLLELNENDVSYRKHYVEVREKMGNMKPIHAQGQNKIHEILRVFDMSYEYGPCVGVSRLDRWERAHALGLNPPPEVKDILTTRQGTEQKEFSQSVLFHQV